MPSPAERNRFRVVVVCRDFCGDLDPFSSSTGERSGRVVGKVIS